MAKISESLLNRFEKIEKKMGCSKSNALRNVIEYFVQAKDAENADAPAESVCENKPETIV